MIYYHRISVIRRTEQKRHDKEVRTREIEDPATKAESGLKKCNPGYSKGMEEEERRWIEDNIIIIEINVETLVVETKWIGKIERKSSLWATKEYIAYNSCWKLED